MTLRSIPMVSVMDTERLIAFSRLPPNQFDYTTVFLLQMPEAMQGRSRACGAVRKICEDLGIILSPEFFYQVSRALLANGMSQIYPNDFVVSKTKEGALDEYRKVEGEWHKTPCHPVLMQISGKTYIGSLFVVSRTAQDAVRFYQVAKKEGILAFPSNAGPMSTEVLQFTEHVMPGAGSYAMYDCELYLSHFQGRLSKEQVEGIVARFPEDMLTKLVGEQIISKKAPVWVIVKRKSRDVVGKGALPDFKSSSHFLMNIWAHSEEHLEATTIGIRGVGEWMKACNEYLRKNKHLGCLEGDLTDPASPISFLSLDISALPGGKNGFQTLLSSKKPADPKPYLEKIVLYMDGKLTCVDYVFPAGPHAPGAHISTKEMGWLLFSSLYTVPKLGMQFYSKRGDWLQVCIWFD